MAKLRRRPPIKAAEVVATVNESGEPGETERVLYSELSKLPSAHRAPVVL